jgi:hypothetical protein
MNLGCKKSYVRSPWHHIKQLIDIHHRRANLQKTRLLFILIGRVLSKVYQLFLAG